MYSPPLMQANRRQIRSAKTNRHQRLTNDHELVENVENFEYRRLSSRLKALKGD